jgi:hypothetical protein
VQNIFEKSEHTFNRLFIVYRAGQNEQTMTRANSPKPSFLKKQINTGGKSTILFYKSANKTQKKLLRQHFFCLRGK